MVYNNKTYPQKTYLKRSFLTSEKSFLTSEKSFLTSEKSFLGSKTLGWLWVCGLRKYLKLIKSLKTKQKDCIFCVSFVWITLTDLAMKIFF